jgi:C4-dicarboxylate-specific signal transduction histidine kinase
LQVAQPLRRQILLLNAAVLIPVFGAAAWSTRETYRDQLRQLEHEARALSGSLVVYLERGLDISEVQTVIGTIPLTEGGVIMITDAQSLVLARSRGAEKYVGVRAESLPLPPRDVPPIAQLKGLDGVERVYANAVFEGGPWLVSVGIPTALAGERMEPFLWRNLSIALGATWLALLLEFILLRPYEQAVDRATGFASRVAAGDLRRPNTIPMPSQELDQLQNTLVTMVDSVRDAREKLAAQIEEERRIRNELESLQQQVIRRERLAAIGLLASGVAHELNNPLQAILGSAELLQVRDDLPAAARADLGLIQKESARASAIIRNLSRFSRQKRGAPVAVPVREVVASVIELRERRFALGEIELEVQCTGDPAVLAVFEELQQVILNFVINAEQAVQPQLPPRHIRVEVVEHPGGVRVEVHDNGPGVGDDAEAKLFQPFFTTKPSGEGTGLGLSVSYGILQSHGGTIGYRPSPLGGAMFFFELPAVTAGVPS